MELGSGLGPFRERRERHADLVACDRISTLDGAKCARVVQPAGPSRITSPGAVDSLPRKVGHDPWPQDTLEGGRMTYELRVLEGDGEIEQALRLRVRVWRDANVDLPVDACGRHRDGDDAASTHVGVLIGERLVAASRMTPLTKIREHSFARPLPLDPSLYPGTVCFLSRLVVAPEARGRGLGRSLIEWMVNRARCARRRVGGRDFECPRDSGCSPLPPIRPRGGHRIVVGHRLAIREALRRGHRGGGGRDPQTRGTRGRRDADCGAVGSPIAGRRTLNPPASSDRVPRFMAS